MPFQVFRRHQRKMLAILAIMAMFGFVLTDSLNRFLGNRQSVVRNDEVVTNLYGRPVYESQLDRLRVERGRANFALSQLAPYFPAEVFGPTTTEALVDAYILEHEAEQLGIPASPQIAKTWVFEQAKQQHQLLRLFNRGLPEFDPDLVARQLEAVYQQVFKNQISDLDFLGQLANQIRITKVRDLIAPPIETPLDSFHAYESEQLRVEAKYVGFKTNDYLAKVGEPKDQAALKSFFERSKDRSFDPSTGEPGFEIPRRIRVEFLTLGLNALDLLKEEIRSRPLAQEIRAEEGFREALALAYSADQAQLGSLGQQVLPALVFSDDPAGELTPPPTAFVDRFVEQQVDQKVEELLRDEIELILDPVKEGMYTFVEGLEREETKASTGIEVPSSEVPRLDGLLGEVGKKLADSLGPASSRTEGITFTRLGLTRLLADPERVRDLVGPDGITPEWRTYFDLVGIDWSSFGVRRQALELLQSVAGLESVTATSERTTFPSEIFEPGTSLYEPREYTDPIGRRYLVWMTLDLPEVTLPFERIPEGVVVAEWKQAQARELAEKAAEALASKVREEKAEGSPGDALTRLATAEGLSAQTVGQRIETDPLEVYLPIKAGADFRDAVFSLSDVGADRAVVAPDQPRDVFYVLAMASRKDRSLPPDSTGSVVDYRNAINNLGFYRRTVENEGMTRRAEELRTYLREKAGLAPDWTPPEPTRPRGEG